MKKQYPKYVDIKDTPFDRIGGRQSTHWYKEIAMKCEHKWQPVTIEDRNGQPDLISARVYCICMKCCSWSYIETGWINFYLNSPDLLEGDNLL